MKNEENKYIDFFNDYFLAVNDMIKFHTLNSKNKIVKFGARKIDNFISSTTPINYDNKKLKEQYEKLFSYENDADFFNNLIHYGLFLEYIQDTHLFNFGSRAVSFYKSQEVPYMYFLYVNHKCLDYKFKINVLYKPYDIYHNYTQKEIFYDYNSNVGKEYKIEIIDKLGPNDTKIIKYNYYKDELNIPDYTFDINGKILFINSKKLINDTVENDFIDILENFLPIFFDKYNGEIYVEDVINGNLQVY